MKLLVDDYELKIQFCAELFHYGRAYEHRLVCGISYSTIDTEKFINNTGFYIITDNNEKFYFENFQLEEIVDELDHFSIKFVEVDEN